MRTLKLHTEVDSKSYFPTKILKCLWQAFATSSDIFPGTELTCHQYLCSQDHRCAETDLAV